MINQTCLAKSKLLYFFIITGAISIIRCPVVLTYVILQMTVIILLYSDQKVLFFSIFHLIVQTGLILVAIFASSPLGALYA